MLKARVGRTACYYTYDSHHHYFIPPPHDWRLTPTGGGWCTSEVVLTAGPCRGQGEPAVSLSTKLSRKLQYMLWLAQSGGQRQLGELLGRQ